MAINYDSHSTTFLPGKTGVFVCEMDKGVCKVARVVVCEILNV